MGQGTLQDTPAGFLTTVRDLTTGQTGSTVASEANGVHQREPADVWRHVVRLHLNMLSDATRLTAASGC
jgi:hypothetical protein